MAWALPIIENLLAVQEAVTFIQFIEEEAIQTCSLGLFMAMRAKNYKAASWCIQTLRGELVPHLKQINDNLGWMAPYSKGPFIDFITATETNLLVYDELLLAAALKAKAG